MTIEVIEAVLVSLVLFIQVAVFVRTRSRIFDYRRIMPETSILQIASVAVPSHELQHLSPQEIIAKYATAGKKSVSELDSVPAEGSMEEVSMLLINGRPDSLFEKIRFSVNNYLIRNRGAATDFNLIKDVVERNTSAIEEDINLSVAVPLYLGLMGTMMGIVIGLFSMPDLGVVLDGGSDAPLNEGINMLIGGVRIAMIASFAGLFLTVLNSGWSFRSARRLVEARKNDFYTFVQIELLPIINQGMASTLGSLQRNLMRFNEDFNTNLSRLDTIFDSNAEAIRLQKELLDTIAEAKISEMAKYNVKVLNKLEGSVVHLERFNEYLANVNLLVGGTQQIVSGVNGFLTRTEELKRIADTIDQRLDQSGRLLEFLSAHFNKLEDHKVFTEKAVVDVGHAISGTFDELRAHIGKSTDAVKQFTVDELDALRTALSESKTNLSNLHHLEALAKDVSQMKSSTASQMERLKSDLGNTVKALEDMNTQLKAVNGHLLKGGVVASVKSTWGKLFSKNGPGLKK
jgi:hypothetical protein